MFHEEFYPTPKPLIRKMIEPYYKKLRNGCSILEPSAGKGDILDYIKANYCNGRENDFNKKYCIEINDELCYILQQKGYKLIDKDFLQYKSGYFFDLIIMNPPFSNGDQHLLKAWEIMQDGDICCLLNAETIRNPHTTNRQRVCALIEQYGQVEYFESAFVEAERRTGVEIALVRLHKKSEASKFDFFDSLSKNDRPQYVNVSEEALNNQVARTNIIENLVTYYENAKLAKIEAMRANKKLEFYIDPLITDFEKGQNAVKKEVDAEHAFSIRQKDNDAYNAWLDQLKVAAWRKVFNDTKMRDILTGSVRKKFEEFSNSQSVMDFTVNNINALFDMLILNRENIMEDCVVTVFDEMIKYHAKNKIAEGWKTNDSYKVNKKVIMPSLIAFDDKYGGSNFSVDYSYRHGIIEDIDKVICFITGSQVKQILTISEALKNRFDEIGYIKKNSGVTYDNEVKSTFFTIRFHKKGSSHLIFNDEDVWQQFNMRAAKGKMWLGSDTKS